MARLLVVLFVLAAALALVRADAPPCREVAQMISPCVAYLAGRTRIPYAPCCGAVLVLNRTTPAASDRAALCGCLKSITPRLPTINLARVANLPRACGLDLNVTISPSLDCQGLPSA